MKSTKQDLYTQIGNKIKELRTAKKATQESVAEKLGITSQQFYKYEIAKDKISLEKLNTIAKMFDVGIEYFLGDLLKTKSKNQDSTILSEEEKELVALYRKISKKRFQALWMEIGNDILTSSKK